MSVYVQSKCKFFRIFDPILVEPVDTFLVTTGKQICTRPSNDCENVNLVEVGDAHVK